MEASSNYKHNKNFTISFSKINSYICLTLILLLQPNQTMTIKTYQKQLIKHLQSLYDKGEAQTITQWLLEHITGWNRLQLIQQKETVLTPKQINWLEEACQRLDKNEPIQYIIGEAPFYDLSLKVNPSVLIPRPETEELVFWVKESWENRQKGKSVLDIGTGSGCIALLTKHLLPQMLVHAVDISPTALEVAKENANKYQLELHFSQLDILEPSNWTKHDSYDVIISNPPYIPQKDQTIMEERVYLQEPSIALFVPDDDPLLFYRQIAQFAQQHLKPNGELFLEIHEQYGHHTSVLLEEYGFQKIILQKDLSGRDRMIKASI